MLAKLKSDGWRSGGGIVFVLAVSLAVGLLVWFILSRGADSPSQTLSVETPAPVPLALDDVGEPDEATASDATAESEGVVGTDAVDQQPSKGVDVDQPESGISWGGWQLLSIDGVELTPVDDVAIRCRVMSTDRIPNHKVVKQLIYQISQTDKFDLEDFHISQINNYYRCDLNLQWSAIIVGYEDGVCIDLNQLNGALKLTTGRGDQAKDHPALAPWIGCSEAPGLAGSVGIELSQTDGQPSLAEVTYQGTFRVFIPKNDYSQIISLIRVELEPGVYGILKPVRIERL